MAKTLKAPEIEDLMRGAVEVPAYYGSWECPKCKEVCYYTSVPLPELLALHKSENDKLRYRLSDLRAMVNCFRESISDHLSIHKLEEEVV